jgi:hypothetical protein
MKNTTYKKVWERLECDMVANDPLGSSGAEMTVEMS